MYPGYVAALTDLSQYQKNILAYGSYMQDFKVKTISLGAYRRKIMPVEEKERLKKEFPSAQGRQDRLKKKFFAENPDLVQIYTCPDLTAWEKEKLKRNSAIRKKFNVKTTKMTGCKVLVISKVDLQKFLNESKQKN